ncbi:stAR-related lipid transfer protein 5 isoform X1 [Choloepus didactylus]|uniref:stAR-related lipid transfer protein 5 isoform X1 n=1 Tax=Choloepus didactylus TaxID=27675 RepID=UPI0018A0A5CE|nr:stAR-related lipid transfer protein 5 isoform X1 [Choloepus didactylus]
MDPALAARMSEAIAEKVLQYRRDAAGWKICREGNGVSVSWRPSVEFPGNLYRGEGIVWGAPEKVWDCIKPVAGGLREKWDENVTGFEIIESITDTLSVSRTTTPAAAMKLISPRDFVDLVLVKKYEDGAFSSNASNVEHPLCPPKPGYVRGFNHPCGCFCEPLPGLSRVFSCSAPRAHTKSSIHPEGNVVTEEPNKTRLVTFFHTDLSGYLPQTVVDSFFPRSMARFYANLQEAVKKFQD